MTLATGLVVLVAALLGTSVALAAWGQARWEAATRAWIDRLEAARTAPQPRRPDAEELAGLPPPVRRYLQAVLPPGAPVVTAATLRHAGTFDVGAESPRWRPFRSTQRVATRRPGFVWDGRVQIVPGLQVCAHDAYVAGEGFLHPAVAGLVSLMRLQGGGAVAHGELMRYLAEAAWYPTALLPSQGVRWEAVDAQSARATLADGPVTVTLTFVFGADGLIDAVRADARGRTVAGRVVPTPWEGRWSRYETRCGLRVPTEGEVAWLAPEGRRPYWRGRLVGADYAFDAAVRGAPGAPLCAQ